MTVLNHSRQKKKKNLTCSIRKGKQRSHETALEIGPDLLTFLIHLTLINDKMTQIYVHDNVQRPGLFLLSTVIKSA